MKEVTFDKEESEKNDGLKKNGMLEKKNTIMK